MRTVTLGSTLRLNPCDQQYPVSPSIPEIRDSEGQVIKKWKYSGYQNGYLAARSGNSKEHGKNEESVRWLKIIDSGSPIVWWYSRSFRQYVTIVMLANSKHIPRICLSSPQLFLSRLIVRPCSNEHLYAITINTILAEEIKRRTTTNHPSISL